MYTPDGNFLGGGAGKNLMPKQPESVKIAKNYNAVYRAGPELSETVGVIFGLRAQIFFQRIFFKASNIFQRTLILYTFSQCIDYIAKILTHVQVNDVY